MALLLGTGFGACYSGTRYEAIEPRMLRFVRGH